MSKLPDPEPDANNPPRTHADAVAWLAAWNARARTGKPPPTIAAAVAQVRAEPAPTKPAPRSTPAERKTAIRKRKKTAAQQKKAAHARQLVADAKKDARRAAEMESWVQTVEVLDARPGREVEAWHLFEGEPWPVVPAALQRTIGAIDGDPSGACCRNWFNGCELKAFAALVRRVALVPDGRGGWLYSWGDLRARQTVASAALLLGMKRATERSDHWCYVADGMTREFIGYILRDPHIEHCAVLHHDHAGQCVSRNKLTGRYGYGGNWNSHSHDRGNSPGRGCGILKALEDVGAISIPPNYMLPPRYVSDGHQPNAYWLLGDMMRSYRVAELMDLAQWEQNCEVEDRAAEYPSIYDGRAPPA